MRRVIGLWVPLACAATLVCGGCASVGSGDALLASDSADSDNSRLIVVTVANDMLAAAPRPGSTQRTYSGTGVYLASDAALTIMRDIARQYSLTEVGAWPIAPLKVHCSVFRIPADRSRAQLLGQLAVDSRVRLAQPMNDFATSTQTYNDPYLDVQRGFRDIDAAGAQQWSLGEHVRVAVIDTGLDAGHPDFGGRVVVRRNFIDRDTSRFEQDRHGTAVAGVISASANNSMGIVGVAPEVDVVALKACWQLKPEGEAARCNSLTLAQALVAAMDERVQIVNLSLTGPPDPLLNSLVAAGTAHGIIFVGAAPAGADPAGFPAGAPDMITVDSAETGPQREGVLRAPGRDVVTLVPGGRYDFLSGSSLATAHVTGVVALLLAKSPGLDRKTIYGLLSRSAWADPSSPDHTTINACAAMAELSKLRRCPSAIH
ncbi:MAG: S8 family serine peptidase [Pseudomonadota bacterium]